MTYDATVGVDERQKGMAAMSCRKPPKKDDHCKPRRKKCDRGHGHDRDHDRRKKCKSHDKPWKPPVRTGGGGGGGRNRD